MQQRKLNQSIVTDPKERRFKRSGQRQVMRGRHQRIQQRHHVLHLGGISQLGLFGLLAGNAQRLQGFLHLRQARPAPRQDHDVFGFFAGLNLQRDKCCRLAAFQRDEFLFKNHAGCGQTVAPNVFSIVRSCFFNGIALDLRQIVHRSHGRGLCAMAPEVLILPRRLRALHGRVDGGYHLWRVAPRVVAAEQVAIQPLHDKLLRGDEHLRLGATKAVDALLGVAYDEDAGCPARGATRAISSTCIPRQPSVQRLPLQRAGVLKLVDHQVFDPRVQPLLHPTAHVHIRQHVLRRPLHVVHIHPAAFALQGREFSDQQAR